MPLIRSAESQILPGKRQQWGELAKALKDIVAKHGVDLRFAQLMYGGAPNTVIATALVDDWESLAARSQAIVGDADYQALLTRASADPAAEPLQVSVLEDITEQVGGDTLAPSGETVFHTIGMRVLAGKQAKLLNFIRQMREARVGAGLPTANVLRVAVGDANTVVVVRGYADSASWAADQAAGQPDSVTAVVEQAQADADFPYADVIGSRVMHDITDSL